MAPRTKEQQIAYNEKRRAENAAKKVGEGQAENILAVISSALPVKEAMAKVAKAMGKPVKAKRDPATGAQVMTSDKGKASVKKAVKTTKAMAKADKAHPMPLPRAEAKAMHDAAQPKGKRKVIGYARTAPVSKALTSGQALTRKVGKGPHDALGLPIRHNLDRQIKTLGADSLLPEAKQNARVVNPTMASAYVRNGKPGAGMLRGKNYQATVTFTPEQFMELKDKAAFWNRSLAEQIRWCCVEQLSRGKL